MPPHGHGLVQNPAQQLAREAQASERLSHHQTDEFGRCFRTSSQHRQRGGVEVAQRRDDEVVLQRDRLEFGLGVACEPGRHQRVDLGPGAGAQVTSDLIAGTAGFSVGDLNKSLADLAGVQAGLSSGITAALGGQYTSAVTAAQSQVDALSSASIGAPGAGQGFTIVINTGVGDPVAIGAQVKSVLTSYDQRAGKLTVQGPKKKAKTR